MSKSVKYSILDDLFDYLDEEVAEKNSYLFCGKYGFRLEDLETSMQKWINDSFWCYSVKELAYEICSRVYDILDYNADFYIEYHYFEKQEFHTISFGYEDLMFIFDLKWIGNSLSIVGWDLVTEKDYEEKYKKLEDIEYVLNDDEEEF